MRGSDGPIAASGRALVLADVAVLSGVVLYGQRSHGISVLADPVASLEGLVPFLAGWLVVAALAGLYTNPDSRSLTASVRMTTVTWLGAANVGFVLRASPAFDGGITWPFPLVMTGIGLVVLVGWRVGYAFVSDRR